MVEYWSAVIFCLKVVIFVSGGGGVVVVRWSEVAECGDFLLTCGDFCWW